MRGKTQVSLFPIVAFATLIQSPKPTLGESSILVCLSLSLSLSLTFSMNLRNWLLAVEGSPSRRMLMSPRRRVLSGRCWGIRSDQIRSDQIRSDQIRSD